MNDYSYSDVKIGMVESFSASVTEEMQSIFAKLSGDVNPLHLDEEFAREHGFPDKVVYGLLTSSLVSRLAGVYLPGKYCLLKQVELKYLKPVYIGDNLVVTGEVIDKNDTVHQIEIMINIVNQHGTRVVKGKIKTGILKEE